MHPIRADPMQSPQNRSAGLCRSCRALDCRHERLREVPRWVVQTEGIRIQLEARNRADAENLCQSAVALLWEGISVARPVSESAKTSASRVRLMEQANGVCVAHFRDLPEMGVAQFHE